MELVNDQLTLFWCHECDMSVALPTTTTVACPHCFSDLLELMDSSNDAPEAYRLNGPLLRRLIDHLSADTPTAPPANVYLLPASKAYVDAIPTVKIPMSTSTVCAVCKEQFAEDAEAMQLACSHVYHPACILPWLSSRSSCPLCRFQLPTDDVDHPHDSHHRIQRLVHYRLQLHDQRSSSSFNGGLQ